MVGYVVGGLCILAGISLWGLAIFALVSWVMFCFGTVIIGLLLLFFAPHLLLFPLAINIPGTALISYGRSVITVQGASNRVVALHKRQDEDRAKKQKELEEDLAELESMRRWMDATGTTDLKRKSKDL